MLSAGRLFSAFNDFCRHAARNRIIGNIAVYHRACRNNAALAYGNSVQNNGICAYPAILAD